MKELSWLRGECSRMKSFSVEGFCEEAILDTIIRIMQFDVTAQVDLLYLYTRGIPQPYLDLNRINQVGKTWTATQSPNET